MSSSGRASINQCVDMSEANRCSFHFPRLVRYSLLVAYMACYVECAPVCDLNYCHIAVYEYCFVIPKPRQMWVGELGEVSFHKCHTVDKFKAFARSLCAAECQKLA